MADLQVTFTIPSAYVPRVIAAMNGLFKKENGFTDAAWAKECVRRFMIRMVERWEKNAASTQASAGVVIPNEIVT